MLLRKQNTENNFIELNTNVLTDKGQIFFYRPKAEHNAVLLYNFNMISYSRYFENTHLKTWTEITSPKNAINKKWKFISKS